MGKRIGWISPAYVKQNAIIQLNVEEKLIGNSILTSQELYVYQVLGKTLYDEINIEIEASMDVPGYIMTERTSKILAKVNPYLSWLTIRDFVINSSYKLTNKGVVRITDPNALVASEAEIQSMKDIVEIKSDEYKRILVNYLKEEGISLGSKASQNSFNTGGGIFIPKRRNNCDGFYNHSSPAPNPGGDYATKAELNVVKTIAENAVPQQRTITINGTTYDLSEDREWTVSGGGSLDNYYTKEEVDLMIANVEVDLTNYFTKADTIEIINNLRHEISVDYYNKEQIDVIIDNINSQLANRYTKAEVDSLLANRVPVSRTITINGETYDLSANRSWTIQSGGDYSLFKEWPMGVYDGVNDTFTISYDDVTAEDIVVFFNGTMYEGVDGTDPGNNMFAILDGTMIFNQNFLPEEEGEVVVVYMRTSSGGGDLTNYYTKAQVDNKFADVDSEIENIQQQIDAIDLTDFYVKSEINALLNLKADKADTYTKTEVDALIENVEVDLTNYYTKSETYSKTEVDALIENVEVDLSNYYDKDETNDLLDLKANSDDVYSKEQVDTALSFKVDKEAGKGLSEENYTLAEKNKLASLENFDPTSINEKIDEIEEDITDLQNDKADKINTYTKTETDSFLNDKVDKEAGKGLSELDFSQILKDKYDAYEDDILDLENEMSLKANQATTYTKTETDGFLATKADKTTTITINGNSQDLSANRSWTVEALNTIYESNGTLSSNRWVDLDQKSITFSSHETLSESTRNGLRIDNQKVVLGIDKANASYDGLIMNSSGFYYAQEDLNLIQATSVSFTAQNRELVNKYFFEVKPGTLEFGILNAQRAVMSVSNLTAKRTYQLPNASGTIALTSDIPSVANYYTKTETDSLLSAKANQSTTYTKTEVDSALGLKANASDVAASLNSKVDKVSGKQLSDLNFSQALKDKYDDYETTLALHSMEINECEVDIIALENEMPLKADKATTYTKTEVDTAVDSKLDALTTIDTKTANYSLVAADNGKVIRMNSASGLTLTIPTGLPQGFNVIIMQAGTGQVTISGATINIDGLNRSRGQYALVTIIKIDSTNHILGGDLSI